MQNLVTVLVCCALGLQAAACASSDSNSSNEQNWDVADSDGLSSRSEDVQKPASHFPFDLLKGPNSALFDCSNPAVPDERYAVAPLTCVTDQSCEHRLVVGHRGAGGEFAAIAPENSLAAIRAALWMGLDGVELDVRHTSDDQLVVMHDTTVDRTTLGTGEVEKMTLAELTQLKLKPQQVLEGVQYQGDFSCSRVPSLTQALELTRDRVFVDLDTKTSRIDLVVSAIIELDMQDQVFVSVSDWKRAVQARSIDSRIRVQVRPDTVSELETVLGAFAKAPPDIVEIPSSMVEKMSPSIKKAGSVVFTDVFAEDAVARLIGSDTANYIQYFDAGVHIVQSEFPGVVLQQLKRNPPNR